MVRTHKLSKAHLKHLHERKHHSEKRKNELIKYLEKLKKAYVDGIIPYSRYIEIIHHKKQGRTIQEWIHYYHHETLDSHRKIQRHFHHISKKRFVLYAVALILTIFLFSLVFNNLRFAGFVAQENQTLSPSEDFSEQLKLRFSKSETYTWIPENKGNLSFISLYGIIEGTKESEVKIYVDDLLILDSSNVEETKQGILTGKAVEESEKEEEESEEETKEEEKSEEKEESQSESAEEVSQEDSSPSQEESPQPSEEVKPVDPEPTEETPEEETKEESITEEVEKSEENVTESEDTNETIETPEEENITEQNITEEIEEDKPDEKEIEKIIKEFENFCQETCNLRGLNLSKESYEIKIEISGDADLKINRIRYGIISENISKVNKTEELDLGETNGTITTVQERAIIGQPVKWKKKIELEEIAPVKVSIPAEAENITAYKIEEAPTKGVTEDKKTEVSITGLVTAPGEGLALIPKLIRFIRKIFAALTGRAISEEVEITLDQDSTEYEVEYFTEAPQAKEENLTNGKRVIITGPDTIHYENILAFTNLENEKPIESILLYHIVDGERISTEFNASDTNNNGLIDYIEWNVPHLSTQYYEISFDTASSASGTADLTFSHTVGAGPNKMLVVGATAESSASSAAVDNCRAINVTYDGVELTRADEYNFDDSGADACASIWYLINPPEGTADIFVDYAGTVSESNAGAISLFNVSQTSPENTTTNFSTGNPTLITTITTTNTQGAWLVDAVISGNSGAFATTETNQTERWDIGTSTSQGASSTKLVPSPGTSTMGWTQSANRLVHVIAAFAPHSEEIPDNVTNLTPIIYDDCNGASINATQFTNQSTSGDESSIYATGTGYYVLDSSESAELTIHTSSLKDNFTRFTVDAWLNEDLGNGRAWHFGIGNGTLYEQTLCRSNTGWVPNNGYYVCFYGNNGGTQIYRVDSGTETQIANNSNNVNTDTYYNYTMELNSSGVFVFVNDTLWISSSDTTYSEGYITISTGGGGTNRGNMSINNVWDYEETINNTPTTPNSITCNGGNCNNTFANNINIQCSGSTDENNDTLTYFIDAYYSETQTITSSTNVSTSCQDGSFASGQDYEFYSIWNIPGTGTVNVTKFHFYDFDGSLSGSESVEMALYQDGGLYNRISEIVTITGSGSIGFITGTLNTPIEITLGQNYWIGVGPSGTPTYAIARDSSSDCSQYPPTGTGSYYETDSEGLNIVVPTGASQSSNKYVIPGITYEFHSSSFSWVHLGSHIQGNSYSWNISDISPQTDIKLRCNSTDGLTQSSYFAPGMNLTIGEALLPEINLTFENGTDLDYISSLINDYGDGTYDLNLTINNEDVASIFLQGYNSSGGNSIIFESDTNENWGNNSYAVSAETMIFENMTLSFPIATGVYLQKCTNWSMSTLTCNDDEEWDTIQVLTLGQPYSITINSTDPGFVELTIPDTDILNDGYARESTPSLEYGARTRMLVGNVSGGELYSLIQFNISQVPDGVSLTNATLRLRCTGDNLEGGESIEIGVHDVYQNFSWDEGTGGNSGDACTGNEFCWNNQPSLSQYNQTYESALTIPDGCSGTFYNWNVLNMVQRAKDNNEENISIYLLATGAGTGTLTNDNIRFNTKETGNAARRPVLNVTYQDAIPPNVTNVLTNETLHGINDSVLIYATVIDNVGVDTVLANVTLPNSTYQTINLNFNNITMRHEGNFNSTQILGQYNVTIIANDTENNINNTEKTFFLVVRPDLDIQKIDSPDPVQIGQNITYNITYNSSQTPGIVLLEYEDFSFVTNDTNDKNSPQMIESSQGTIIIAYHADSGINNDIYIIRSTNNGANWSSPIQATDEAEDDTFPNIYQDNSGNILIAYVHADASNDIWLINSSNDGLTWSEPVAIASNASVSEFEPAIEQDSSGMYYLTYAETAASDSEIMIRNSTNFQSGWSDKIQITNNTHSDYDIELVIDDSDNFYFAWAPEDPNNSDLQEIWFAKTANPLTFNVLENNKIRITNNSFHDYETSINIDNSGNIYIGWVGLLNNSEVGESNIDRDSNELFLASSFDSGTNWDIRQITENNISDSYPGILQTSTEGLYYISALRPDGSNFNIIFSQRINSPEDAINVTIQDQIPNGTTLQEIGQGGTLQGDVITWKFPIIYAGDNGYVSFIVGVNNTVSNGTIINNTANISYYDASDNFIETEFASANTTAADNLVPSVTDLFPNQTLINQTTNVTIKANVSDDGAIDTVFANISIPGSGNEIVSMSYNATSQFYEGIFTNTSILGQYNYTIFANDSVGNINNTESSFFTIINSPVSIPTNLTCNGGSCNGTFNYSIELNCSGSIDPENDLITYHIEAFYEETIGNKTIINAEFETDNQSFIYQDDLYGTSSPTQATGEREANASCPDGNCLNVELNLNSPTTGTEISGGWNRTFNVTNAPKYVEITFNYTLRLDDETETNENITIQYRNLSDNSIIQGPSLSGLTGTDFVDEITSGQVSYKAYISEGGYAFDVGCLLSSVDSTNENGECWIDNILIKEVNTSLPEKEWYEIGTHNETNTFIWDISSEKSQTGVDFRCRAIDNGSNTFSDYYTIGENATTLLNNVPQIIEVSSIPNTNPIELSSTKITFYAIMYDADGVEDLNDSSVKANFSRAGQATRENSSCLHISDINSTSANYSCTIDMWYFDEAGDWNISVYGEDLSGNSTINDSTTFQYNLLQAITVSENNLTFNAISGGINITADNDPVSINNTGNANLSEKIAINATNLLGETNPNEIIYAENFSVSINSGQECIGDSLQNSTAINVTGIQLEAGNLSLGGGTAQEELYYCIKEVPSISSQIYSTSGYGSWIIKIVFSMVLVLKTGKGKKKKRKIIIDDLSIPITIFTNKLGGLEALSKYLKENLDLTYHEIALLLERNDRTIWTAYNKSTKKQLQKIKIKKTLVHIPSSIFKNRKLTIFEAIVVYLKDKGMKYVEIAELLNRDQRNIWTIYNRTLKK